MSFIPFDSISILNSWENSMTRRWKKGEGKVAGRRRTWNLLFTPNNVLVLAQITRRLFLREKFERPRDVGSHILKFYILLA